MKHILSEDGQTLLPIEQEKQLKIALGLEYEDLSDKRVRKPVYTLVERKEIMTEFVCLNLFVTVFTEQTTRRSETSSSAPHERNEGEIKQN